MTGGLLGEAGPRRRPSGCGSIQSSMMSETQRSLASLESMMSSASRQYKFSHLNRNAVISVILPDLQEFISQEICLYWIPAWVLAACLSTLTDISDCHAFSTLVTLCFF